MVSIAKIRNHSSNKRPKIKLWQTNSLPTTLAVHFGSLGGVGVDDAIDLLRFFPWNK